MAEAKRESRTVVERIVTLTLTLDEAESLKAVTRNVAGDTKHSRRKDIDAIGMALSNAGVYGEEAVRSIDRKSAGVLFKPTPTEVTWSPGVSTTSKHWGSLG